VETFQALERENPQSLMAPYYLGRLYTDRKQYPQALEEFKKSVERRDDFEAGYLSMGLVQELMGKTGDAIETYRKVAALNPHNFEIIQHLAQLYIQQNDLDNALALFQRLLDADPENHDAQVKIGLIYSERKQYEKAAEYFAAAAHALPEDLKVRHYLASSLIAAGRYEDALKEYTVILERDPDDIDAILQIAISTRGWTAPRMRCRSWKRRSARTRNGRNSTCTSEAPTWTEDSTSRQ
jgi:tetratricopeptide (TPR) repeat protein